MFKNIANFSNTSDTYLYLMVFNYRFICHFLLNTNVIKSVVLKKWYNQYNLSAVMADVLIIFIGLIIVRFLYYYIF